MRPLKYRMKNEIKQAFETPKPMRKQEFLAQYRQADATLNRSKSSWSFWVTQVAYVQKSTWVMMVALFIIPMLGSIYITSDEGRVLSAASVFVPFLVCILMKEWLKPKHYQMAELELSCRHSLFSVLMVHFAVIGAAELLLMIVGIIIVGSQSSYGYTGLILYLCTPWLLTGVLCFYIIERCSRESELWICLLICSIVSLTVGYLPVWIPTVYDAGYKVIWGIAFVFLTAACGSRIFRMKKNMEVWLWN